ncbi:MAG: FimV/HubP family polar landmark protein, partial [Halioglobus sp.]
AVVFSLGALQAESALALGLGELKLQSYLNEPLKASVDLLNTEGMHGDEIKIRLATREDFKKLGLDRSYFLTSIKFDVEVEGGRARIVMTSDEPVLEPYLDFIVEARWPSGRLLREYTVLIDPPVFADGDATPVISASQRVEEVEGIPAPAKKKSVEVSSSGTTVGVKESDLAPGMMPSRDFNSATSAVPMAGSKYMVHRDQTLWEIASQARPQGVSVHQTMLDIQRLNPDAFINGNINNIKAGYIIYLPSSDDISGADLSSAMAEVSQQNRAWRDAKAAPATGGGPALRISAEPDAPADDAAGYGDEAGDESVFGSADDGAAAAGVASGVAVDSAELEALQSQVDTLQRMIDVKDEQIAALQDALDQDGGADEGEVEDLVDPYGDSDVGIEDDFDMESDLDALEAVEEDLEEEVAEVAVVEEVEPEPEEAEPAPAPAKPAVQKGATHTIPEKGGFMDYINYIIGALVLAIVGFFVVRRRGGDDAEAAPAAEAKKDVFSDVKLKEEPAPVEKPVVAPAADDADSTRGYGERKHDAYASDVEAADALAEADIYIAYGRHRQAIDLLNNALASEPGTSVYLLKLIEIYAELNDRPSATVQMEKLVNMGDEGAIARAESVMEKFNQESAAPVEEAPAPVAEEPAGDAPGLAPNPLEMMPESGDDESDFEGLEIETEDEEDDDDLDLSADFEEDEDEDEDDEELVIAADANGLSTKMDLARAYLDMGDEDGARQILEEVIAEGSEELKAEARSLLERIG